MNAAKAGFKSGSSLSRLVIHHIGVATPVIASQPVQPSVYSSQATRKLAHAQWTAIVMFALPGLFTQGERNCCTCDLQNNCLSSSRHRDQRSLQNNQKGSRMQKATLRSLLNAVVIDSLTSGPIAASRDASVLQTWVATTLQRM